MGWRWEQIGREKRTVVVLVGAAVLAVGVGVAIARAAEFDEVLEALGEAEPVWLAVCFGGEALAYSGYILAFREAARVAGGPPLSLGLTTHVTFVSLGAFAAASAAGGLTTNYWAAD